MPDGFHATLVYQQATDSWQWHMDNDSASLRGADLMGLLPPGMTRPASPGVVRPD